MAGTASQVTPQDLDKNYAIIGVQGTLGTADTKGTSVTMPIGADPSTGAMYVYDLAPAGAQSNPTGGTLDRIKTIGTLEVGTVTIGAVNSIGTIGTLQLGTVTVTNPTGTTVQFNNGTVDLLKAGTITTLPNIPGGTINVVAAGTINSATAVLNSGTINVATAVVTSLPNLPQGSINVTAGTIATLGTMGTLGLVNTVTAVSNLTNGSINVTAGTIATLGTMGTLGLVSTVTTVSNLTNGSIKVTAGTEIITSGSVNVVAGTMNTGTLNTGTINTGTVTVAVGTINHGTIDAGTVRLNPVPTVHWMPFGTTTTGTIGTLVAAPSAGSAILLDSLDISLQSGTAEVLVSYGLVTTGNGVVMRGNFGVLGGLSKTYASPLGGSITGSALTYNILSGSGTVSYSIGYAIQVP
jgi:hypothetical protein